MDSDTILDILVRQLKAVAPELEGTTIGPQDSMAALGVDSISRQEVLILTMEELGLDLPMVQLFGPKHLGELARLLQGKLGR